MLCSDEQAVCGDCLSITKFDQVAHSQILATDLPLTGAPILPIGCFDARVHPCICALVFAPSPQIGETLSKHAEEDHEDQGHDRGKRVVRTDRRGALEDRVDHIEDICHAEELDEAGYGKECETMDEFKKNLFTCCSGSMKLYFPLNLSAQVTPWLDRECSGQPS